jgi:hypothetical protein
MVSARGHRQKEVKMKWAFISRDFPPGGGGGSDLLTVNCLPNSRRNRDIMEAGTPRGYNRLPTYIGLPTLTQRLHNFSNCPQMNQRCERSVSFFLLGLEEARKFLKGNITQNYKMSLVRVRNRPAVY